MALVQVGQSWNGMSLIETAGDLDADGDADLLGREASTGFLYFYRLVGALLFAMQAAYRCADGIDLVCRDVACHGRPDQTVNGKPCFEACAYL